MRFQIYIKKIILLFLISGQFGWAATISGIVKNEQGHVLGGVSVSIENHNSNIISNQFGQFYIEDLEDDEYKIEFNYMGYQTYNLSIKVSNGHSVLLDIIMIEEILKMDALIVTAQKYMEQIKDVPIALSVITGQSLDNNIRLNLDNISGFIPGLLVNTQSSNRPNFVIRGLTSDAFLASEQPRVSVFYNNIPISRNTGAYVELMDMERIEVLKGPQGTLFGRGAMIGAVHLISKKPEEVFESNFSLGIGNYGQRMLNGAINVPIMSRLYTRFAFSNNYDEGYIKNTFGGELNQKNSAAFRSSIRYFASNNSIIDLVYDYQKDLPGGTAFKSKIYPNQKGQVGVFDTPASLESGNNLGLERTINNITLNVRHYFNTNVDLNSFISFRQHMADEVWDGDGTAAPALDFSENTDVTQFTFESRLHFRLGNRFNAFAGISYWDEKVDQRVQFSPNEQSLFFLFTNPDLLVNEQGIPNIIPAIPPSPEFGNLGGLPLPADHVEESYQQSQNQAIETYFDGTYVLTRELKLTAGLRFIGDRLSLDAQNKAISGQPSTLGFLTGNAPNVLIAPGELSDLKRVYGSLVGRLILTYSPSRNTLTYLGYSRGRRPNVIQLRADAQAEVLDDEEVNSYEMGLKANYKQILFYDASAYFYSYNDFQTRSWIADRETGEYQLIVKDGGAASAYGLELGIRYLFNRNIEFHGTYAYIHARFDNKDSNGNAQDYANNTFRLTPEHTWSIGASFKTGFTHSTELFIAPLFSYKSDYYFEDANSENLKQTNHGIFNIQSGISYLPHHLELAFYAYNILNAEYYVSAGNTGNLFGIPTYVQGLPFTYGLKIRWTF